MNETNAGGVRQRSVEIVVPVHNEAHVLGDSIGRLHAYLEASFPFPFRITIADNASTDATWQAASRVDIVATAVDDLKGMGRMQRRILTGRTRVALPPGAGTAHMTAAAHGAASVEPGPGGDGDRAGAEPTSPPAGAAAPPARARAA
ncbi:glycosyltransferase [Streptomyces mirabilis]|uniref:glycosyltransferase n=1 Tax=Streptomyces mirabilis TaxID=68239 RepID=UPI0021C1F8DA|nr:glycosyltransferase [Streptomyces mirabilis]MCT9110324.1 glycosyltransferase [Streptomyces mirabilis]